MEQNISIQYYVFKKKLMWISFYRKEEMSYEEIAYILSSRAEIVKAYCTLLHDA